MSEEPKKLSDEERFQLDQPPDDGEGYGEPTRDPTWQELAESYIKEHDKRIKALDARITSTMNESLSVLDITAALEKTIKAQDARLTELEGRKVEKEPTPEPEKVTVTMSMRSWNIFDRDLHTAEYHLVGVLAKIRNIRVNISDAMGGKLVDQARGNLIKTIELGERMDEHSRELEKLAKGIKDEDTKEA